MIIVHIILGESAGCSQHMIYANAVELNSAMKTHRMRVLLMQEKNGLSLVINGMAPAHFHQTGTL